MKNPITSSQSFESPVGWGNDPLSNFQKIAFANEMATFAHTPEWQGILSEVSSVLDRCAGFAIGELAKTFNTSLFLFLSAHNNYLAVVRCATAGHCLPAYSVGRAAVEFALYGWYLVSSPESVERWHDKPIDKKGLNKWGREFTFSNIAKGLGETDKELSDWAKYLHQTAIDFGGHPNKAALYSNIEYENRVLKVQYLHPWNCLSKATMKFAIEVGLFSISLFSLSFNDLDLAENIAKCAKGLAILQRDMS
ncbi:MAG: hypothetical protein V2B20_24110 [Pseudomonadota bacterium]